MKTDLFSAMNEIQDKYYEEALNYTGRHKNVHRRIRWSAMAACFVLTVVAASSILPNYLKPKAPVPDQPDGINAFLPDGDTSENPNVDSTADEPKITVRMDQICLNELGAALDAARLYYDPELYDYAKWDQESASRYFGKDLAPAYIPDGLALSPLGGEWITDKEGNTMEDTVYLGCYHDYLEDGSPKRTEDVFARKGFSITASKIGLLNDCIYILPENEVLTSEIGNVSVTFGYRSMPYGPYDPETHEPSGYYDLYTADFVYEGIEYSIVSEQLPLEELVKVTASIICGEEVVILAADFNLP